MTGCSDDPGATHYLGCDCVEARHRAELAAAQAEVERLKALVATARSAAAAAPPPTPRELALEEALRVLTEHVRNFTTLHHRLHAASILYDGLRQVDAILLRQSVPRVVTQPLQLRPVVAVFAQAMERKLIERGDDDGGWRSDTWLALIANVREKTEWLVAAIQGNCSPSFLLGEAANVGNAALMLVDVFGAFAPSRKTQEARR